MTHAGEQAADAVAVPVPGDAPAVVFRPLTPDDTQQCKELHCILFPIEYEEDFYTKTVYGRDGERPAYHVTTAAETERNAVCRTAFFRHATGIQTTGKGLVACLWLACVQLH